LTTYSLGLRLEEALSLQVGDIDAGRKKAHIRRGKGHKDRMVPLPDLTLQALRPSFLSSSKFFRSFIVAS
jgi:integrase/recombinase XerD